MQVRPRDRRSHMKGRKLRSHSAGFRKSSENSPFPHLEQRLAMPVLVGLSFGQFPSPTNDLLTVSSGTISRFWSDWWLNAFIRRTSPTRRQDGPWR